MKHYRIKVRDDKAEFFEELLRYLDFLDYEEVENFSEPRIYPNFDLNPHPQKNQKNLTTEPTFPNIKNKNSQQESYPDNLREVMARIDQLRDQARKSK
ncbi:hypothetical protein ACT29H_04735 [Thermophagus sp. OGC60D27]|uniref:hypothetical protein n=1 Tax=Thermophagus sp. OGC60D27 TaxID=3458415 RepID=UPI004037EEEF